jgi:hypothetical protein
MPLTQVAEMALQELVIVNPKRKSRRAATTKRKKVNTMARRRTTRRKTAPKRRVTTRRRTTTKRRAAPKRRRTTRRKTTTRRRAAPTRRRTTRRKTTTRRRAAPKRRRTTRRKTTTRRRRSPARRKTTRRRRSPARRKTTRRRRSPARRRTTRRRSPARRKTTRRRTTRRRSTTRSRKMSMKGMYNFIMNNMTAFEAIAALGVGLVAGLKLPALAERAVAKVMGRTITLTDGWKGPLVGAALAGALGYSLYGMKLVNFNVASTIALAGATVGMLNLANTYLNLPLPGVALMNPSGSSGFGFLAGSNTLQDNVSAFGYLGEAPFEPFGMSDGSHGYHDMGRVVNVF